MKAGLWTRVAAGISAAAAALALTAVPANAAELEFDTFAAINCTQWPEVGGRAVSFKGWGLGYGSRGYQIDVFVKVYGPSAFGPTYEEKTTLQTGDGSWSTPTYTRNGMAGDWAVYVKVYHSVGLIGEGEGHASC